MSYLEDPNGSKQSRFRETLAIFLLVIMVFYFFSRGSNQNQPSMNNQTPSSLSNNLVPTKTNHVDVVPAMLNSKIKETEIHKETNRYLLDFSSYYGTLKRIVLKDFQNAHKDNFNITPNVESYNSLPLLYSIDGYSFQKGFAVEEKNQQIIFRQQERNLLLEKIYTLNPNNYDIHLTIKLTNKGKQDILSNGKLIWGLGLGPFIPEELRISYDKNITLSYYDTEKQQVKDIKNGEQSIAKTLSWLAIDNRYFAVAIMPFPQRAFNVHLMNNARQEIFNESMELADSFHLIQGESVSKSYVVYMGPKISQIMKAYQNNLERLSERGWFFFPLLGSVLVQFLGFLKSIVGSYAISIILFALLLRLIFHPLNQKSMIMMSRQADVQVKIQAIREKFPDKQIQNMKVMELYRQENISPLKGCLPMLIQIPFFISFYNELPGLLSLTSEHFLWIKDLSSPDTLFTIAAFKNIPILPYRLNILPLIIAVFTFIQTWVSSKNSTTVTQQAKVMMYLMPIVFLFILWNAPSALNLYWLIQTIGTILSQLYFNKHKTKILQKEKEKNKKPKRNLAKIGK